jgi:hypothetical protein
MLGGCAEKVSPLSHLRIFAIATAVRAARISVGEVSARCDDVQGDDLEELIGERPCAGGSAMTHEQMLQFEKYRKGSPGSQALALEIADFVEARFGLGPV